MTVVHNHEQLMAWKRTDVQRLVGKRIALWVAADQRTYWHDPHTYAGAWDRLAGGTVLAASMDVKGENVRVDFAEGGSTAWILGQPVRLVEEG